MQYKKTLLTASQIILCGAILSFVFLACKPSTDTRHYTEYEETSFEVFYERFHKDSQFQIERINFPLAGLPGMADSATIVNGNYFHTQENWKMLQHIEWDTVQQFNRRLEDTGIGVINEYICTEDYFCMVRRFAQLSNGWHLVYYADMNYRPDLR